MALVSKEEIIKLARMSRMTLKQEEVEDLSHQLNEILTYAARVVDIASKSSSEKQPQNINIFREDKAHQCPVVEQIIAQAPEQEEHYFVVPAILDHE